MKDFITNIHEKQICERCKFEYLKSDFCKNCAIDTHVVEKSHTWFEDEDFKKFGVYDGINLGEMMDYNFRKILFQAMAKIEKDVTFE
jgi:hypothetical protein